MRAVSSIRLPADIVDQLDELVVVLKGTDDFRAMRVSTSSVVRMAILRGIKELRKDFIDVASARDVHR